MTDKELAVQLYSAFLQSTAGMLSNPNFTGSVRQPTVDEMVQTVAELAEKLSRI